MASAVDILLQSTLNNVNQTGRNLASWAETRRADQQRQERDARREAEILRARQWQLDDRSEARRQQLADRNAARALFLEDRQERYRREDQVAKKLREIQALEKENDRKRSYLEEPGMEAFSENADEETLRTNWLKAKQQNRLNEEQRKIDQAATLRQTIYDEQIINTVRSELMKAGREDILATLGPEMTAQDYIDIYAAFRGSEIDVAQAQEELQGKTIARMLQALEQKKALLSEQEQRLIDRAFNDEFRNELLNAGVSPQAMEIIASNPKDVVGALQRNKVSQSRINEIVPLVESAKSRAWSALAENDMLRNSSSGIRALQEEARFIYDQAGKLTPRGMSTLADETVRLGGRPRTVAAPASANPPAQPAPQASSANAVQDWVQEMLGRATAKPEPATEAPYYVQSPNAVLQGGPGQPSAQPVLPAQTAPQSSQAPAVFYGESGSPTAASPGVRNAAGTNLQLWNETVESIIPQFSTTIGASSVKTLGNVFSPGYNEAGPASQLLTSIGRGIDFNTDRVLKVDPSTGESVRFYDPVKVLGLAAQIDRNPNATSQQKQAAAQLRSAYKVLFEGSPPPSLAPAQ